MKILIAGAGEIGYELSRVLSEEKHDVTVIDTDKNSLKKVTENLDVLALEGNATSPMALIEAGVQLADIMIAVTSVDEVNIIASMMAKRLGVKSIIARVRNNEFTQPNAPITPSELGIDVLIHPEMSAATEIHQLIKRASASDIVTLAEGHMQLIGVRFEQESQVVGKTLEEFANLYNDFSFRVVAISRRGTTIIPRGSNRIMALDQVFIICKTENLKTLVRSAGHQEESIRRIMIAGGTEVGHILARKLSKDDQKWKIKLIEPDPDRATDLANELKSILVLNGNPTDPNLLAIEGIQEMDAFISVTDDEESNLISCLMAKHMKVKKTLALVSKSQYVPLSQTIGLDAVVNVKAAASDEIHRYVRHGNLLTVKALQGINAEIIEVIAGNKCAVLNTPIHSLKLPEGMVIGGILNNGSSEIATGDTVIKKGDRVIIFTTPDAISKVEEIFQ